MPDFSNMSVEDFEAWKMVNAPTFANVRVEAGKPVMQPVAAPPQPASPQSYEQTASEWLSGDPGQDYTLPSGRTCRMKPLPVEELAATGMLDRLTRLQGITQTLIDKSEGKPPAKPGSESQAILELLSVLNIIIPMVVVQPKVWPIPAEGEERLADRIYPESIPFTDRVAILNKAAGGVMKFDNFRQ